MVADTIMSNTCVKLLAIVAALLVIAQYAAASLGDRFIPESLDHLNGNELCELKDKRISHLSSIKKLLQAFESDQNIACKQDWLLPLRRFQAILDSSAIDACSFETIERIEQFHWYYVAGSLSVLWKKASEGSLPEPLRLFFIHFVYQTMEGCKSRVGSRLKEAIAGGSTGPSTSLFGGAQLGAASAAMMPKEQINKFDSFFFIFQWLINLERKRGNFVKETKADSKTGERVYMSMKLQDTTRVHELQDKCKQQLRPIYSQTVLPVMKLVDLGFGFKGQEFYHYTKLLAEWYEIAQFCELLLPVRFYSSQELNEGQAALVVGDLEEEAQMLAESQSRPERESRVLVKVTAVQLNDLIPRAHHDKRVVKSLTAEFRSRVRDCRKTLKYSLAHIAEQYSSGFRKLFISRKVNNQFVVDATEVEKTLVAAEEAVDAQEENDESTEGDLVSTEASSYPIGARRMSLTSDISRASGVIAVAIAGLITYILSSMLII